MHRSISALGTAVAVVIVAACSKDLTAIDAAPGSGGATSTVSGGAAGIAEVDPHSTAGASAVVGGSTAAGAGAPTVAATYRKRGIAYGYNSDADLSALSAGIGWWYNWSPKPDDTLTSSYTNVGVDFVPMIWGGTFDTSMLATQVPGTAKFLLTFNEPNFGDQSNLTPEAAAALWPQIEAFAKQQHLAIVSPAPNYCGGNCNETSPFDWLDAFFAACPTCQVDYVAFHWYACTKDALTSTLGKYHKYDKPLWLTEFSCLDDATITVDKESQYMEDAVGVLEADPLVYRYAWFTGRFDGHPEVNLLDAASGQLTPLGQKYLSLPVGP